MRARLGLIILVAAGLLLVAAVIFVSTRGRPTAVEDWELNREVPLIRQPGEEEPTTEGPIQVSGTELTVADEAGKIIWRASFGGEIELDQAGRTARAGRVHWEFEGEGFDELKLDAPLMTADYDLRLLNFSEGVKIEAEGGAMSFSASQVKYEFGTRKLICTGDVRMRRGAYVLTGDRLVIDNNTETIRVTNGQLRKER